MSMKIADVITAIKKYHRGTFRGKAIDESVTRDRVLYGDPDRACTGIVTTCFASVRVIKEAAERGANLIISHEALFWNHGDHTDWLADNTVFQDKKALLDRYGITVWRDHDYIHSGIPIEGGWTDGIFYGLMKELGWESYLSCDIEQPIEFMLPKTTASAVAREMIEKIGLNGMKIYGDPETPVQHAWVCGHIYGPNDNAITAKAEAEHFDLLIPLEIHDFTTAEYVRDASLLGHNKAIICCGHFNTEEPGMKYMAEWLQQLLGDIRVSYVQSGDSYSYIGRQ